MKKSALYVPFLVLAACGDPTQSTIREIGNIGGSSIRRIDAPDTVRAGIEFAGAVYTWGSGSRDCNAPDGVTVVYGAQVARVTPYVRFPKGEYVCTSDLRSYSHEFTARFDTPGEAAIRLVGFADFTSAGSRPLDSLQRRVVVVP
ncbi:MAG: hypothetical protein ABJB66_02905 [Gemmatimonadaceae bacterium]